MTLDALEREAAAGFDIVVVDQSARADPALDRRDGVRTVRDSGRGLSRARNRALAATDSQWIAFVDDDCSVDEGFGEALLGHLRAADSADWLSGHVGAGDRPETDLPVVTTFPVPEPRVFQGRWVLPGSIGFGVFFVVRSATARRLGGWDERLGPGVEPFPAADDMDFNHRLLRDGGRAVLTPDVRAVHRQWRNPSELVSLNRGYLRAWSGLAAKQARTGHPLVALWMWGWGVVDVADMVKSAVGRRSRIRSRIAGAKLRGLLEGAYQGLRRSW